MFHLDIKLWQQYHAVPSLKCLARRYDISIAFLSSENTLLPQNCKENIQDKQKVMFPKIVSSLRISKNKFSRPKITLVDFTIKHTWNFVEKHQIYCLFLTLSYGNNTTDYFVLNFFKEYLMLIVLKFLKFSETTFSQDICAKPPLNVLYFMIFQKRKHFKATTTVNQKEMLTSLTKSQQFADKLFDCAWPFYFDWSFI